MGKSQLETLPEKDFFFLRGGCGCRTRGRGGGGGSARSGREGGREEIVVVDEGDGVVNAAEAWVNGVRRVGM